MTLCVIGLGMTILVYGTVALIIKADDFGLFLQRLQGESIQTRTARSLGRGIIVTAPKLMKLLSFLGTAAIFLVGGEIIAHGIPPVEHMLHHGTELISSLAPFDSESLRGALNLIAILGLGFFVGLAIVTAVGSVKKLHALYLLKK
jgi:predicted DNA repair protein MutK